MKRLFTAIMSLVLILSPATYGEGSHLERVIAGTPQSLNPHFFGGAACASVIYDISEGLLTLTPSGDVVDGIAIIEKKHIRSRLWHFRLRDHLRWSNGDDLTGYDVLKSFQHLAMLGAEAYKKQREKKDIGYAIYLEIARIKNAREVLEGVMDPTALGIRVLPFSPNVLEFELECEVPESIFPYLLTFPSFIPVHRSHLTREKSLHDLDHLPEEVITNGPYCIDNAGTRLGVQNIPAIELKKNPHYYSAASVETETVRWNIINDREQEKSLLFSGEIDITASIPAKAYKTLKDNPRFVSTSKPLRQSGFLIPPASRPHILELTDNLVSARVRDSYKAANNNPLGWVFTKYLKVVEPAH